MKLLSSVGLTFTLIFVYLTTPTISQFIWNREGPPNPFLPRTYDPIVQPWSQTTEAPGYNSFLNPASQSPDISDPIEERPGRNCQTPDGKLGECIDIKSCPFLLSEVIVKGKDPELVKYIQTSRWICGNVNNNVCCPTDHSERTAASENPTNYDTIPHRLPTVEEGCGISSAAHQKVVGGEEAKKGDWPWIAILGYMKSSRLDFLCGGTLITARHVVTAAHCLTDYLILVRLGEHDLTTDREANHIDFKISKKVAHPQYNRRNGHSDIAIIYLERNVEFTDFISPICMPSSPSLRSKSYVDTYPFVIGWGRTMEGGPSATVLHELMIPVLENSVCRDSYAKMNRFISENQFDEAVLCAGVLSGGKDSCNGDSGGPLMTSEGLGPKMRFYLIGVVSYGVGCARSQIPGVYASTQYFMDWILEKLKENP